MAVAEELHFGQAAKRLQMTQQPLSKQIRDLEAELGVELFHRTKRHVQLTEAGQVFLEEVREILLRVEQGLHAAQRASRGEIGRLNIGFEGSFSYDIVPFSVRTYQQQFPDVELILQEMPTGKQKKALVDNQVEVGFIVQTLDDENLVVETLMHERLILALPKTHSFLRQPEVLLQELAEESFIMGLSGSGCGLHKQIIKTCHQAGFDPRVVQETNEIQMMLGFVAAGIGISLLPASVKFFQRPGVVYRELGKPTPEIELAMAWHRDNHSPVLQSFLKTVRGFIRRDSIV